MKPTWKKYLLYGSGVGIGGILAYVLIETIRAKNTGFETKTLWDWMELLIIPFFLAAGALYLERSERANDRKTAEVRAKLERKLATDRQQEAALQAYLDRMAELLLKDKLRTTRNKEVRNVARIRTLTILRGLDGRRKGIVLLFLYESGLILGKSVISLAGADLSEAELEEADLKAANLSDANLKKANLRFAHLDRVSLKRADLSGAHLQKAELDKADLEGADLSEAHLESARLTTANLSEALMRRASLRPWIQPIHVEDMIAIHWEETDLSGADLSGANLSGADLERARLEGANLSKASLSANLHGAKLSRANLSESWLLESGFSTFKEASLNVADLSEANLNNAIVSERQLATVKSLKGATMPDGAKHD